MNGVRGSKSGLGGPRLQLFNCSHSSCGATFSRQWKLREHETVHTGAVRGAFSENAQGDIQECCLVLKPNGDVSVSAAALSVSRRRLWSSLLAEVSPEPPHDSAQGAEAPQVSRNCPHYSRCPSTYFILFHNYLLSLLFFCFTFYFILHIEYVVWFNLILFDSILFYNFILLYFILLFIF